MLPVDLSLHGVGLFVRGVLHCVGLLVQGLLLGGVGGGVGLPFQGVRLAFAFVLDPVGLTMRRLFGGGTSGRVRPPPAAEAVAKLIPGARYRELTTGHYMATATPELVADAVNDFLVSVGA